MTNAMRSYYNVILDDILEIFKACNFTFLKAGTWGTQASGPAVITHERCRDAKETMMESKNKSTHQLATS